jgi:hypothetical protein
MKFYTITGASCYLERPLIKSFHANMFHGLAERDGKEWPKDPHVWANTESFTPLQISRTIRGVPDICEPGTHLVVSERLATRLSRFQNIRIAPVHFKRLVDIDWKKGDHSWFDKWGTIDPAELLRTQPDVPELHTQIGPFFEIQTFRWKDIIDLYPSAEEITIEVRTPPTHGTEVVRISTQMLTDYPMFWWMGTVVNPEVFDILDSYLDRDFFVVRKYEVS